MAATNRSKLSRSLALMALLLAQLTALPSLAISADRDQQITVEADYAERDVASDTMVYRGNVVIRQGGLLIEADQVELFNRDGQLQQIVSSGQLARYTQQATSRKNVIIAEAEQIDYQPSTESITLLRNATLSRDGTLLKGERIDYDFNSQSWQASGNPSESGTGDSSRRIQLVIPASDTPPAATDQERP